jgi:hypothetical protein
LGLEAEDLRTLLRALPALPRRDSLLILGDAVIHTDDAGLEALAREESFELGAPGGAQDPIALGAALGFAKTQTLDANGRASITLDLHEPPPAELVAAYDCVVDAGVLFWCSDPGAALRSIYSMTRDGGLIVHICALTGHLGRGYYDVHPLLFQDFYLHNGCELVEWTARPKYQPPGALIGVLKRLGRLNPVSRYGEPGNVYVQSAGRAHIELGPSYPAGGEPAVLPNNVLGVYVFRKRGSQPPTMPVRTAPYDASER